MLYKRLTLSVIFIVGVFLWARGEAQALLVFSKPMERKLILLVFVPVIKKEDHILPFLPLERKKAIEGKSQEQVQIISLHECQDENFNIKFLCHPNWEIQTDEDVLLVIISEAPYVTMTIARSQTPIALLDQLGEPLLKEIGGYSDGFSKNRVQLGGKEAIEVRGISEKHSDALLLDYYVLHQPYLYSVLFSFDPQSSWPSFETLVKKIRDSFLFVN